MIDKNCPCTKDRTDRPNCKNCERGNAYRNEKILEYKADKPKKEFRGYEMERYDKAYKRKFNLLKKGLK